MTQVLWRFNDTAAAYPTELCVHELVEAQAARAPSAVALEWQGATMTYSELVECSAGVAAWLRSHGVAPDCVVALQLHRSLEQVVGVLGVLVSGGAYLPLDSNWPSARSSRLSEDAGCAQLVAHDIHSVAFAGPVLPLVDWHSLSFGVTTASGPARGLIPPNLAYALFTSGSTGHPKGVLVMHAGLCNVACSATQRYPLDRVVQLAVSVSIVFDVFQFDVMACLGKLGGTCVLLDSGLSLLSLASTRAVTCIDSVPSIISEAFIPQSVVFVEVGGEALTQSVLDHVEPRILLYNTYGPAEVTVNSTQKLVKRSELPVRLDSIGIPTMNMTCYTSGESSAAGKPIGVWGELWLGGVQVARGYLNRPELTAEKFVANPWAASDPSGRGAIYRTGDRVRWYADGELEFGGRLDFQVKLRGQRIELGEIEHALRAQPGVVEAVVLLLHGGEQSLVAYVSPASVVGEGAAVEGCTAPSLPWSRVAGLRGVVELPAYMLPSVVVGVDEWPRTSSGKIDRKQLPPPSDMLSADAGAVIAPRTAAEATVRDAFAAVLALEAESVSVESSFFELGGNSLRAVLLARRLSEALGRSVAVASVLECPTVAGLAACDGGEASMARLPPLTRRVDTSLGFPSVAPLPVSFQQEQLLTYQSLFPQSTLYNCVFSVPLPHASNPERAARDALQTVVRRHALLRTFYSIVDGEYLQIVLPPSCFEVPIVKREHLSSAFELCSTPPIRAQLVASPDSLVTLTLCVHHVVLDHQSLSIFAKELIASHTGKLLAPLELQYADYAMWQSLCAADGTADTLVEWWRRHLSGAPPCLEIPLDSPRPLVQRNDSARCIMFAIDGRAARPLRALCRRESATVTAGLLACWGAYLARITGQDEVVISQAHSLRYDERLVKLIGYFHTVLPLLHAVQGANGLAPAVRGMRDEIQRAVQHADAPYQRIVAALAPARSQSYNPLSQTTVVYFAAETVREDLAAFDGLPVSDYDPGPAADVADVGEEPCGGDSENAAQLKVSYDLALYCSDGAVGHAIQCDLAYDSAFIEAATARRMAEHWLALTHGAVYEPDRGLSWIQLMDEAEAAQVPLPL